MKRFKISVLVSGLVATVACGQAPQAYEVPPVFSAEQQLDAAMLRGPHHRVRDAAPSDGYLIHYTIDSDFGVFTCVGRRALSRRIGEIAAIAKLVEVSKGDLFAKGLKMSIEKPISAVKNIVANPEESVKQAPKTVGHFFSKVGSSVGNAAKQVGKRIEEAHGGGDTGEAIKEAGQGIGEAAKNVAGFQQAKLETARQLGVDPYSDNRRLQDEMEKVTWAFFAGGLPLRVGASVVSGGASAALTATKAVGLPEDVYDLTPSELMLRDREALGAMGIPAETVEQVFLNPALTVSLRHGMVRSLQQLPGGPGRLKVVDTALTCDRVSQVQFLEEALRMLVARHKQAPYASLTMSGRLPIGMTTDGIGEVAAPVDYVSWTEKVAGFARRQDLGEGRRRLLLAGGMSASAVAEMKSAGWEVVPVR